MSKAPRDSLTRRGFLAGVGVLPLGFLLSLEGSTRWLSRLAAGSPSQGPSPSVAPGLPPRVVGLRSLGGAFRFDPEGILLEPGSELHWLNMGDFHTTTAFHPDNAGVLAIDMPRRIPQGAEPWHSGTLGLTAGTQFTHRFTVEGVYDYFCQPHYSFGMVGRIVVGEPRGGPAVTEPLPESPPEVRENMPAVEEIVGPAGATFEWMARLNGVLYQAANGEAPTPYAEAVLEAAGRDARLAGVAGEAAMSELTGALEAFRTTAGGGDYEAMVRDADAAKDILREIHGRR